MKYRYGADALACGWEGNSAVTMIMLCNWADIIIVVQEAMKEKVIEDCRHKVSVFDVGVDRFFNPNVELLTLFDNMIQHNIHSVEGEGVKGAVCQKSLNQQM